MLKAVNALLLCLFLAGTAVATERYTVVTGLDANPPFSGPSLPRGGLITQIVTEVIEDMGAEVEVEFLPWNHAYRKVENAEALGAFPYVKDQERLQKFYFSAPLYVTIERFFILEESDIRFTRIEDLNNRIICRPLGYSQEAIAPFMLSGKIKLWEPNDLSTCFSLLKAGRVDLVPIGEQIGWATIEALFESIRGFKVLNAPLKVNGYHLMISKEYPDAERILEEFDRAVARLWESGRIKALYQKHETILPSADDFNMAP